MPTGKLNALYDIKRIERTEIKVLRNKLSEIIFLAGLITALGFATVKAADKFEVLRQPGGAVAAVTLYQETASAYLDLGELALALGGSKPRWESTGERIVLSVDGVDFVFEDLSETEKLLARPAMESGAMPDIAAGTFPLLFGDMSGYTIVERLGMSIERFMDSYTGANKIEFHVRRRIGGRLEKNWLFAVQKVSA